MITNKYYPIPCQKLSPVIIVAGQLIRPTRLDNARAIVKNEHGLYQDFEIRHARRIIIKENS